MRKQHGLTTLARSTPSSSFADRQKVLKSVGKRFVELEEQKEQFDDEVLDLVMEIEATKRKAVSAGALSASLASFGDLYQEANPGEQRELIQLRVNQTGVDPRRDPSLAPRR